MPPLNMLPSGPPEKLYLELPRDNFWLSRIGNIEKQISEKSDTSLNGPEIIISVPFGAVG